MLMRSSVPLILVTSLLFGFEDAWGDDPALEELFAHWEDRSVLTRTERYRLSGEFFIAKGALSIEGEPVTPAEDLTYPITREWLIDFENGLLSLRREDRGFRLGDDQGRHQTRRFVFDGEFLKESTSPNRQGQTSQPELCFWRVEDGRQHLYANVIDRPLFFAHGMVTVTPGNFLEGAFEADIQLKLEGESTIDGNRVVVVSNRGGAWLYAVDPAKQGAVVRFETYGIGYSYENFGIGNSDAVLTQMDITYAEDQASGYWMPTEWTCAMYDARGMHHRYHLRVEEYAPNVETSASDFEIVLEPGMIVDRRDLGIRMQVADDGETMVPYPADEGAPTE